MLPPATSAKRRHGFKRSFPFCQFARSRADSLHGLRQQHAVRSPPARGGLRTAIVRLRVMWPFVRAHGRRGGKRRRDSERDRAKSWDRPQGRLRPFWKVSDICRNRRLRGGTEMPECQTELSPRPGCSRAGNFAGGGRSSPRSKERVEARPGFEPGWRSCRTYALPLRHRADANDNERVIEIKCRFA